MVVDHSGSIRDTNEEGQKDNWQAILDFLDETVNRVDISPDTNQVAMITFGDSATLEFDLDAYSTKDDVDKAIQSVPYRY